MDVTSHQGGTEEEIAYPRRLLARALGVQYLLGGTLAMTWSLSSEGPAKGAGLVLFMATTALALGAILTALSCSAAPDRVLGYAAHGGIASAQVVIGVAHAATGDPGSPLLLFFLWTTVYSGIFSRRLRLLHLSWTAAVILVCGVAVPAGQRGQGTVYDAQLLATLGVVTVLVSGLTDRFRVQALRDPLTGLANRREFLLRTRQALDRQGSTGGRVAVVVMDLDRFKNVNDSLGHAAGDALLRQVTPRLAAVLKPGELLARLGGDEFAVLAEPRGAADASDLPDRLCAALARSVDLEGTTLVVTGSAGLAIAQPNATPATLLRDADAAMYRAKASGPGGHRVFDPTMHDASLRGLAVERGLRQALRSNELELHYQPVVSLDDERPVVVSVEALARWTSPELGIVSPAEFIPVAEATGLINALGTWVLDRALRDVAAWKHSGLVDGSFRVAVNVSAGQLTDDLSPLVESLLDRHRLPANALGIEITESGLLRGATAESAVRRLHALGVQLLLDDFGTGYSSLSHLHQLPFHVVKIDRSFVSGLGESSQSRSLVAAVLSLAGALGMTVVAEGIETESQAVELRALGCPQAQGYLFCRPVPGDVLVERLRATRVTALA